MQKIAYVVSLSLNQSVLYSSYFFYLNEKIQFKNYKIKCLETKVQNSLKFFN